MTRPHDHFVQTAVEVVSDDFALTNGGRIFAGLWGADPGRSELAKLLMASLMQSHDPKYREFLSGGEEASAPAPAPAASIASRPVYVRPNGDPYYARKWGKYWDVDVLKDARNILQFPLLHGPPGTGKTAMAESAFGEELVTIVISAETTTDELVGSFIPDGHGGYEWVDGPLLVAVKEGRPILVDEILLGDPKMLSVLYPLMDGRGFMTVTENPKIGKTFAKEGFFLIGTGNPNVPGAKMSEALSSRFPLQVEVTTDFELAEALGADQTLVTYAKALAGYASGLSPTISWAPQFREVMAFGKLAAQWGDEFAINNLLRTVPRRDLETVRRLARTTWPTLDLSAAKI